MAATYFDTPGYNYWTAPENISGPITLIMRGRGADGEGGNGSGSGGSSGGGGAYVRYVISVTPGQTYTMYNGQFNGDDTWFDSTSYLVRAGNVTSGGAADSPSSPAYNAAGENGGSSGGEAGYNGGNAGDEPGGPAIFISAGPGGGADSGPGGNYGGGGASGGSYYYNNGEICDESDPPNCYTDEGYNTGGGGSAGLSAIEIQWVTEPPDQLTQQYVEVFGDTPPSITQQYVEVFGEVLPPIFIDLTLQQTEEPDWFTQTVAANLAAAPVVQVTEGLEYFTPQTTFDITISPTVQTVSIDQLSAPWGILLGPGPTVQEVQEPVLISPLVGIDVSIDPTVQTVEVEHFTTVWEFNVIVPLQTIDPTVLLAPVIGVDAKVDLFSVDELGEVSAFTPKIVFGTELQVPLQMVGYPDGVAQAFLHYPTIFDPHLPDEDGVSHFAEASRSSSSIVIFGSDPGPFKLNVAAASYRRGGRSHVVHTGRVKPKFVENFALFDLVSPSTELSIREFLYVAPGGYLEIWNDTVILSSLIPDSGDNTWASASPDIDMSFVEIVDVFAVVAGTGFVGPRTL